MNFISIRGNIFSGHVVAFHSSRLCLEEGLGSSEESGKDWSDLEREAAEEDKERGEDFHDDYNSSKKKKSSRKHSPSPSKDR